jgi:hypothetical protein
MAGEPLAVTVALQSVVLLVTSDTVNVVPEFEIFIVSPVDAGTLQLASDVVKTPFTKP